jgi:hypothetical protein
MQRQERAQRYLWKADLEASAIDRVELPRRHDRDDARHQLDVDELARCTPLALNATRTPPKERMPAIVDHDILPDMGRMTAQLLWDASHGSLLVPSRAPPGLRP